MIRWRGQVASAIKGKRGQKLLVDLLLALEAMPEKRLIAHDLKDEDGGHCALGVLGAVRGLDLDRIDPQEPEQVAVSFDIAPQLAQEIVFENDEQCTNYTPEQRYQWMHKWVKAQIRTTPSAA